MTGKTYIKHVKRSLHLPSAMKKSIISDLEETFASAGEKNETEEEVIARLGEPRQFASEVESNIELTNDQKKLWRQSKITLGLGIVFLLCCLITAIGTRIYWGTMPANAIGYSVATTTVYLTGSNSIDIRWILCIVFAVISVMLFAISSSKRHKVS